MANYIFQVLQADHSPVLWRIYRNQLIEIPEVYWFSTCFRRQEFFFPV